VDGSEVPEAEIACYRWLRKALGLKVPSHTEA
jgi:hypothetical protein